MAFRDIPLHNSSNDNSGNREFLNSHSTPANSPAKDASMAPKCVISWPSLNATHFTKLHQTNHWSPLIRTPEVYRATHNTMPPKQQVISSEPTHNLLRMLYQNVDKKMAAKRDTREIDGENNTERQVNPRPSKTARYTW